ncbi:MAG: hypothetical protein ACJAVI_001773 [Candidatus Azotimanducaceae bacterium]|jgi:hypothetical protein
MQNAKCKMQNAKCKMQNAKNGSLGKYRTAGYTARTHFMRWLQGYYPCFHLPGFLLTNLQPESNWAIVD